MLKAQTTNDGSSAGGGTLSNVNDGRRRLHHPVVPYAVVGVILAAIGLSIFWRSGYIAGGDVWPATFVPGNNQWQQNWPIWGPTVTGIGSPQYNPTTLVWSLFAHLVGLFHLSGPHQQDVFLVALLIGEGLGTTHLLRVLYSKRPLMAVIVGLAVPLSLYNAIAFLNPIQAFAIGWFPFSAAVIVNGRPLPWPLETVRLGLLTLGLWVLVGTPPMAVVWVIWVVTWWAFSSRRQWRHVGRTVIGAVALAFMLNAWWAYGALMTLGGGSVSQTFSGPLAWSWVNKRASLLNLISMQGEWNWPKHVYYPWAAAYQHGGLPWLLFTPALLALVGVLWVRSERSRWIWTGWIVSSLWLGQGTHAPFGWVNTWLYLNLPLFWLFRDPQIEMDVILLVSLMILAGLAIDELSKKCRKLGRSARLGGIVIVLLGVALMANGYALVSGKAFPRNVSAINSLNVHVPSYWAQAAKFLNSSVRSRGRILVLPNDDFYEMPYRWGYYGTDNVAQSYFHAPVVLLNPSPSGYLGGPPNYQATLRQLYTAIKSHPAQHIAPMLTAMGIHWIVERGDINWQVPGRSILAAPYVMWYLAHQPGIQKVRTIGALTIYRVQSYQSVVSVASQADVWSGTVVPPLIVPSAVASGITQRNAAWVSGGEATQLPVGLRVEEIPAIDASRTSPMITSGDVYVRPTTASVQVYWRAGQLTVRLLALPIRQGSRILQWVRSQRMPLSSPLSTVLGVQIGGSTYAWSTRSQNFRGGHPVTVGNYTLPTEAGTTTINLLRGHLVPLADKWSPAKDCNIYAHLAPEQSQQWRRALTQGGVNVYTQAACDIKASRTSVGPGLIALRVQSKHVEGQPPVVALLVAGRVVRHTILGSSPTWSSWSQYTTVPVRGRVSIATYNFASFGQPTINDYRVAATRFQLVGQRTISLKGEIFHVSAGALVQHNGSLGTNLIPGPLFQGGAWTSIHLNVRPLAASGVKRSVTSHVLKLEARPYAAGGVGATISGVGGHIIMVGVDVRTVRGQPASVALVDESTGTVLWKSDLLSGQSGWHKLFTAMKLPQAINAVSMVLYTRGGRVFPSVAEYRSPSMRIWNPGVQRILLVAGHSSQTETGHPVVSGHGSQYHVSLAHGDRLLVLHTIYSSRWNIAWRGIPQAWEHVRVDGIYNGWVIPAFVGNQHAQLILTFGPARLYAVLWWIGISVSLVLSLYLVARRLWIARCWTTTGALL